MCFNILDFETSDLVTALDNKQYFLNQRNRKRIAVSYSVFNNARMPGCKSVLFLKLQDFVNGI